MRLIKNRKIITTIKAEDVQNPATSPQIINIQIIDTTKKRFHASSNDCLVERFL